MSVVFPTKCRLFPQHDPNRQAGSRNCDQRAADFILIMTDWSVIISFMKNPKSALPKEGIGSPAKARRAAGAASSPHGAAEPKLPSNRASRAAERREAIIAA